MNQLLLIVTIAGSRVAFPAARHGAPRREINARTKPIDANAAARMVRRVLCRPR